MNQTSVSQLSFYLCQVPPPRKTMLKAGEVDLQLQVLP